MRADISVIDCGVKVTMTKKSDHKHKYELIEIENDGWFTHAKTCGICGHVYTSLRIIKPEDLK
jgi:hypothetical protein